MTRTAVDPLRVCESAVDELAHQLVDFVIGMADHRYTLAPVSRDAVFESREDGEFELRARVEGPQHVRSHHSFVSSVLAAAAAFLKRSRMSGVSSSTHDFPHCLHASDAKEPVNAGAAAGMVTLTDKHDEKSGVSGRRRSLRIDNSDRRPSVAALP
jgi:hypothetical protein